MSPARRRRRIEHVKTTLRVSERRACGVLGQRRPTQRKIARGADDEASTADVVAFVRRYSRYGYRRITALLRRAGRTVNAKRVERIRRRERLKVPQRQPRRGRQRLNDGSCVRLRPRHPGDVRSHDFVADRAHDDRWKKQFGGMDVTEIRRLRGREAENTRPKKRVADLILDKATL